jgi:hypothetical protein
MRPPKTPLAPFKSARRFAQSLRLARRDDWRKWAAGNAATLAIKRVPPRPDYAYRNDGWVDWSDWLGSNVFQPKPFVSYGKWRAWLVQQPFRTKLEYNEWCVGHRDERERLGIPSSPALVYAQFRGWPDELSHNPPPKCARHAIVISHSTAS